MLFRGKCATRLLNCGCTQTRYTPIENSRHSLAGTGKVFCGWQPHVCADKDAALPAMSAAAAPISGKERTDDGVDRTADARRDD
jgi:hypothetical protein